MEIFAKVVAVGNVISVNRNRNGVSESVNKREVVLQTLSPMTSRCDFYVSTALHLSHLSHVCLMFVSQMRQVQSVESMRVRRGWMAKSHFFPPLCTFLCENSCFLDWENIKNPCCLMWFSRVNYARWKGGNVGKSFGSPFLYLSYDNYNSWEIWEI